MATSFADQPRLAVIQVPSPGSEGTKRQIPCTCDGMQGKRLILEAGERLPVSTAVSVECEDALFLGEVVACTRTSGQAWKLDIKVEQIVDGLQSLMALRARLLAEGVPKAFTSMPISIWN